MQVLQEQKYAEWVVQINEWKQSGLTQRKWCESKGIKFSTFRHRILKINKEMKKSSESEQPSAQNEVKTVITSSQPNLPEPVFAKVDLMKNDFLSIRTGINIRVKDMEINIFPDANNEHLNQILETLQYVK